MEPQSTWEVLGVFKILLGTIPNNIKDYFEFIETWINITCKKYMGTEDPVVREKWKNTHADRNILRWMLCHPLFVNSMPLAPGTQMSNSL